jgi:glycosyltransferase involved in cell wall biosynthesis
MSEIESCHFLDATSVPGAAFANALGCLLPTTAWLPRLRMVAGVGACQSHPSQEGTVLTRSFALQRGYNYAFLDRALGISRDLEVKLLNECCSPSKCLLICTSPHWAPIAERWPGPVAYYSLDFTYAYAGARPSQILSLDKRLCRASTLVFPVSQCIGDYLTQRAGCDPGRVVVLPNATLSDNIQSEAAPPMSRPPEIRQLSGPIAGVIGNMADNLDWILLRQVFDRVPAMHWVFVGPATSKIADAGQREARKAVMRHPQAHFLGARPYRQLQSYARAFDVAVLPYRRREPTYSGSATRFYEHLAAGRPMIATRNVHELLAKEPYLRLVDNVEEMAGELNQLRQLGFRDGLETDRIKASRSETWDARAQLMLRSLTETLRQATEPALLARQELRNCRQA